VPGWDCHGLPIELNVERKVGKAGHKVDVATFRNACREYAAEQVDRQRADFVRLGVMGDWAHPYLTMDFRFEADIVRSLGRVAANGHLHKGFKPVHWCTDCGSALAEAEVEYEDKQSPAIDVRFAVPDDAVLMARCHHVAGHEGEGPVSVVIWTTTPWTLPANRAVALNPEVDYAVVQCDTGQGPERLVLADAMLKDIMARWSVSDTELFAGEHVFAANDHVIEVLKTNGALVHEEAIRHSYPHCWRHKTPIIFRATPQWFISMDNQGLRRSALEAICQVEWTPDWGQARIESMVANRPDWCISRQRTWGVPIALFVHRRTGELHPQTPQLIEEVALRMERRGIDAWFELDAGELLGADAADYEKVTDTLDVWFDSGVTHACVLERREELRYPADLYLEGSDQHRGWFQSSLLTSVAMRDAAPYRGVLTHGFTVDAKGQKMSKSKGNVVSPQKVVGTLGADILRLWIAATDYRAEMAVSDEILKRTADAYRRMRNTARFLLGNLHGFDPERHMVAPEHLLPLDQWAVERARSLQELVRQSYEDDQFHLIYQRVHNFCAVAMGGFYLDVIKDRQYTTQADSHARRSAQTAMYLIVEALSRWLAPILSFTAEEIWQQMPGPRDPSVFFATWYELPALYAPESGEQPMFDMAFWDRIFEVREAVGRELEKLRVAGGIGASLDAEVDLYCDDELRTQLERLGDELRFVLITSYVRVHPAAEHPEDAVEADLKTAKLWVKVSTSAHDKCIRCWHHREDVGSHPEHPQICGRCAENVAGSGERRRYA
ncbi:MAG: class I tRNA ligase family protein, partial [Gammaproteobacteria bacterium]